MKENASLHKESQHSYYEEEEDPNSLQKQKGVESLSSKAKEGNAKPWEEDQKEESRLSIAAAEAAPKKTEEESKHSEENNNKSPEREEPDYLLPQEPE